MTDMTLFREALGDSPVIRILDFLLEGRDLDYSLTDIAENAGVGWTTLHRIWPKLESLSMVVATRTIGRAKLYKINTHNPSVVQLMNMYDTLLYEHNKSISVSQEVMLVREKKERYGKQSKRNNHGKI